jgi:hypothetical protein
MQARPLFPGLAKGHCLSPLERIETDGGYRANYKALRHVAGRQPIELDQGAFGSKENTWSPRPLESVFALTFLIGVK